MRSRILLATLTLSGLLALLTLPPTSSGQQKKAREHETPKLAEGREFFSETSDKLLTPPGALPEGVTVAKTAPRVDFAYPPGQTYAGNPWSVWGDSVYHNGKYYLSYGDHLAPGGNAYVAEYDPATRKFRLLVDLRKLLEMPDGHYTPGKIHTTLTFGKDGWLYFGTHRGSTKTTTDAFHYKGDWIVRVEPASGKVEVVAHGPVPKHCIPTGTLDAQRMIFYGSTAPGDTTKENEGIQFFAYDVANRKLLRSLDNGPARAMIVSSSTGRVYYNQNTGGKLVRYDPASAEAPREIAGTIGMRAASEETKDGKVYTISQGNKEEPAQLYSFDVKTEAVTKIGPAQVGVNGYVTALKVDPTGRYLYYIPGAHGGADKDGSPVVQYDLKTNTRKILAFLHPFFKDRVGCAVVGTYSYALSAEGDKLFVTWNANRLLPKVWDTVAVTVLHIPATER